jgi:AcrR family transcriptional regulator
LFWEKGYHGTSLKDLEQELDLRPGSIYAAFGSKEQLFAEALDLYASDIRSVYEATMGEAVSKLQGLANHVRWVGALITAAGVPARACMITKTVLETPQNDPGLRARAETLMKDNEEFFRDGFEAARASGELPEDADTTRLARRLHAEILGLGAYSERSDAMDYANDLAEDIARDIEALGTRKPG